MLLATKLMNFDRKMQAIDGKHMKINNEIELGRMR